LFLILQQKSHNLTYQLFSNRWIIHPRILRDVSLRSLTTTVLGKPVSFPIGISPSAMQKLAHPDGECGNARGKNIIFQIFNFIVCQAKKLNRIIIYLFARTIQLLKQWAQFTSFLPYLPPV